MASKRGCPAPVHGYDALFVPDLDKRYQCPVCLAALREPVQTRCGHRFCRSCLTKTFRSTRYSKCPVDNSLIDTMKEIFVDNAVKREILSLTVKCYQHTEGCEWTGELRDLQKHEKECAHQHIPCPNNCKKNIQRRHLPEHQKNCPLRILSCLHCGNAVVFQDMTKHQVLVCMKFPVNCTVCGETGILREDIPQHVDLASGDCPLVTVKCAFFHIGCYFQDKRKNMTLHYRDAYHQHMMMLACKLMQLEEHLQRQRLETREATETSARLSILTQEQQNMLEEQKRLLACHSEDITELMNTSSTGQLLWTISTRHMENPKSSPAFYTSKPGYKFQLHLQKQGNVVKVNLKLLQGRYDEHLAFPINCCCKVTIISHSKKAKKGPQHILVCTGLKQQRETTETEMTGKDPIFLEWKQLLKLAMHSKVTISAEVSLQ